MAFTDFSTKIFPSRIRIGDGSTPNHPLHIVGEGSGTTTSSLKLDNSAGNRMMEFFDDRTLFIGDGSSPDNRFKIHIQTSDQLIGGNLPEGIKFESTTNQFITEIRGGQTAIIDNDSNISSFSNAFGGEANYIINEGNNTIFRLNIPSSNAATFTENNSYRFITGGGNFAGNVAGVARPLKIEGNLLESQPIPSDSGTTIIDSPRFDLVGRYWDSNNGDQRYRSSIRHIMEDNSPISRIGTSINNTEILSVKNNERVGVRNTDPSSTLHIVGEGSTDQTKSLQIENLSSERVVDFFDNGSLFMGQGTSHDSSYPIHVQHPTGSGNRRGVKVENQDENARTFISSGIINVNNEGDDIETIITSTPGGLAGGADEGSIIFRNPSDNTNIFRFRGRTGGGTTTGYFDMSNRFQFYPDSSEGTTDVPHFEMNNAGLIVGIGSDNPSTNSTIDSKRIQIESRYNDNGSLNFTNNYISRIQDTIGSTGGRLQLTGPSNLEVNFTDNARVGFQTQTPNSTLDVNGSFGAAILSADTSYTATTSNRTLLGDASNGAITFTLPAPSDVERIEFAIKKIDGTSSNVNIEAADGSKLDGDTIQTIGKQYDAITAKAFGGQYWLF